MTVQLLSFPFRQNAKGEIITKDDTQAEYCAERLTIILGTRPGERVMVPDFGVNDPAFEGFTEQTLRIQVSRYGLPVEIDSVRKSYISDEQESVVINFDMAQNIYGSRNNGRS